jgi:hypothetical protein
MQTDLTAPTRTTMQLAHLSRVPPGEPPLPMPMMLTTKLISRLRPITPLRPITHNSELSAGEELKLPHE